MADVITHSSPGLSVPPVVVVPRQAAPSSSEEPLYEIIHGQRVAMEPMSVYAIWIASRLSHRLGPFVEERSLGTSVTEMLFILDKTSDLRRRPDLAFVSNERWPLGQAMPFTGDWEVVPDLAVEVVSPNDLAENLLAKIHEYFAHGVRLVWVIYPEHRQVYVYESPTRVRVLNAEEELQGGELLPEFRIPLSSLFQPTVGAASAT